MVTLGKIVVISFAVMVFFQSNTDPFNIGSVAHKITALNPQVAYAASSAIIDGYQPSIHSQIVWQNAEHEVSYVSEMESQLKMDLQRLCDMKAYSELGVTVSEHCI
jgi:hypothetical protein